MAAAVRFDGRLDIEDGLGIEHRGAVETLEYTLPNSGAVTSRKDRRGTKAFSFSYYTKRRKRQIIRLMIGAVRNHE